MKSNLYRKVIVPASALVGHDGHFPEVQNGKYLGGKLRMGAALKVAKENPETSIVLVGGYSISDEGIAKIPDQVEDMARFMKSHMQDVQLELIRTLPCTHHNFIGLLNTWSNRGESPEKVGILTNEYHMRRTMFFAEQASSTTKSSIEFEPLTVEKVLGVDMNIYIRQHGFLEVYKERVALERQGMRQLQDGTYVDPCFGRNFDALLPIIREQGIILLTDDERVRFGTT